MKSTFKFNQLCNWIMIILKWYWQVVPDDSGGLLFALRSSFWSTELLKLVCWELIECRPAIFSLCLALWQASLSSAHWDRSMHNKVLQYPIKEWGIRHLTSLGYVCNHNDHLICHIWILFSSFVGNWCGSSRGAVSWLGRTKGMGLWSSFTLACSPSTMDFPGSFC